MNLKLSTLRGIYLILCATLGALPAHAQAERILEFRSDIRVEEDATMQVVETIRVSGWKSRALLATAFRRNFALGTMQTENGFTSAAPTFFCPPESTSTRSPMRPPAKSAFSP